jgi:hypothetical protein
VRVFRTSAEATDWRIARLNVLTTVRGLYRLSVNPEKEYRIVNLALSAEDFELRIPNGVGFVAETDAGVTGIVILGRGEMTFAPTPAAEKGQVRIYSGSDVQTSRFNWVYLRAHPAEFDRRLDVTTFHVATSTRAISVAPKPCSRRTCRDPSASNSRISAATDGR